MLASLIQRADLEIDGLALGVVWRLSFGLVVKDLAEVVHLNVALVDVERARRRRNMCVRALADQPARDHVITLDTVHCGQDAWEDG